MGVIRLRLATLDDVAEVLPRTRALNAHEGIVVADDLLETALRRLLGDASLGSVWLIERDCVIGYAIATYGYDLEVGGRDAYLTELWIDEAERGRSAATKAIELLAPELRARDVRAVHLQVRHDNPAQRLYERRGFVRLPRYVMTRRLV